MSRGNCPVGNVRMPPETRTLVHKQNRSECALYTEFVLSRPVGLKTMYKLSRLYSRVTQDGLHGDNLMAKPAYQMHVSFDRSRSL